MENAQHGNQKKKAALHNLGCKVNAYETEAMQQMLEQAGYEIVPFEERADVYVVNTCSVTNIADRKSRQMLHRARRNNPDSIIVACGCYVQSSAAELPAGGIADIILGNNKKAGLVELIRKFEADRRGPVTDCADISCQREYEELSVTRTAQHTRAFLKVQDGCSQFCSYCIIPYTRGRVRSRRIADVTAELARLAAGGCKEAVLTGIHLSSYGADTGDHLLHLIEEAQKVPGIERIRLGSLEPGIVTEEFARTLSGFGKICPHFHLSLQSGCDATLRRMNRRYDTAQYEERCGILRRYFDDPAVTTDVIVGFPGETEEEFLATYRYLERIRFYEMHVFKYSRRKGTKADAMDGQVPEQVKAQRSRALLRLGTEMSAGYRENHIGREVCALLEEPFFYEGRMYVTGYTKEYIKVAAAVGPEARNTVVRGRLGHKLTDNVYLLVEF